MSQGEEFDDPMFDERPSPAPATRVDAAHVRADEPVRTGPSVEPSVPDDAPIECTTAVSAHQVRLQAAQLASHLQRQQTAVDHRESELNARVAAMENQIRGARLWLEERHAEMAAQMAELDRRDRELTGRAEQHVGDSVRGARRAAAFPPHQHDELDRRAAELDRREAELERMAARMSKRLQSADQNAELRGAADSLDTLRENLRRAETLLSAQQADLAHQRSQLAEARDAFAETMQQERRKLADERGRLAADNDRIQQDRKRQADELAARHAAIERVQGDVARSRQEALEIRLATEELWARLCGTMAPAALTQALAQTRLKLAEEQRLARSQLAQQGADVEALAAQLAAQLEKYLADREEIQDWVQARRQELERHAGLLAAREREMQQKRAEFDEQKAQWQSERFRLEQEVCRLLRQSGSAPSVAAA